LKARGSGNTERVCEREREREREIAREIAREREKGEREQRVRVVEDSDGVVASKFEDAPTEARLHDRTDIAPRRGGPGEADEGEASVGGDERTNVGATDRQCSDGGVDVVALEDRRDELVLRHLREGRRGRALVDLVVRGRHR